MATAEELLQGLRSETEEHIVIDSNRRIIVPASLKKIAVQFDHNVETLTFDCPRYWDEHDMSTWNRFCINYTRSDGYEDCYNIQKEYVEAEEDIIHFDWVISNAVTEIAGGISFNVCIKNVDENDYEINHWNSEINSECTVSKGMENTELIIEQQYDLVSTLKREVVAEVEDDMAEVLASLNSYAESLIGGDS